MIITFKWFALLLATVLILGAASGFEKTAKATSPIWWFDYETMSVCWRADLTNGSFHVDFDGDHSTEATTQQQWWYVVYGKVTGLTPKSHGVTCGPGFFIGELKIDYSSLHTNGGGQTEWFYFWVPKDTPPTDWVVCLQRSNGTSPIPVTSTFWVRIDGVTPWTAFTPFGHDIAVLGIAPYSSVVKHPPWFITYVDITVANQGGSAETFNMSMYANGSAVWQQSNYLEPGLTSVIKLPWNNTGFEEGIYVIGIYVHPVLGETDVTNNNMTGAQIRLVPGYDINCDGRIDLRDVFAVGRAYGSGPGKPRYNPNCDVNWDGKIDLIDYYAVTSRYGQVLY